MKEHPARKQILHFLRSNPEASIRDIEKATGLSSTSHVDYHITKLIAAGCLKKVTQRWEVIERLER